MCSIKCDVIELRLRLALSGQLLCSLFIGREESVRALKLALLDTECDGIPSRSSSEGSLRVSLVFAGKVLRETQTIESAGVENGSLVDVIFRRGRYLMSASHDTTARIWCIDTGACSAVLSGHTGPIELACVSADGASVVTASQDSTAKIWTVPEGTCLKTLEGHRGPVIAADFSPQSICVATCGLDRTIRMWRPPAWDCVMVKHTERAICRANSSPNLTRFACVEKLRQEALIRDKTTGEIIGRLVGHESVVTDAVHSLCGTWVATSSGDGTAKLWDAKTLTCVRTLRGHKGGINSCDFSSDSSLLVTASNDLTAKIWVVATGECVRTLQGHLHHVKSAKFSPPPEKQIATASRDCTAKLWNTDTGECVRTFEGHQGMVVTAQFVV